MESTSISEKQQQFLPVSRSDMDQMGWDQCDFILITGDAYVDHPSFGAAVISRVLEAEGYRVGIIAQPDWEEPEAFRTLGEPRLGFLITAGNIDSMVARYTVNKRFRSSDSYSPGGKAGCRPDRALIMYTGMARRAYKGVPVIIGGLEASLRRMTHYDYWSNKLRRSVLLDSKADILVYGMGEKAIKEIATLLNRGISIKEINSVRGTVYRTSKPPEEAEELPPFSEMKKEPELFGKSFAVQYKNTNPHTAHILKEDCGGQWAVQNPPAFPLDSQEMDRVYELPYTRKAHPMYKKQGGVPALKEVEFSLVRNRGCYGNCSFCSLTFHQGRTVTTRSDTSLVKEAEILTTQPGFKGYIHDVGGPTANFSGPACEKQGKSGPCSDRECLGSKACKNLNADQKPFLLLLRKLRKLPGVKKVFVRSGIRFDYLMRDTDDSFLKELCAHHISGQLKVAPEHISDRVLKVMNKPPQSVYTRFSQEFVRINKQLNKKQYLIPYLISSHPGAGLKEAIELALFLKETGFIPQQVQDFYPTPGTLSTCIWFTGKHPLTGEKVHCARSDEEKKMQRALLQFNRKENRGMVRKALLKAGRKDLIGKGPHTLIP